MEALTYSTVAVTLGLVVARPRVGATFRISPAMAGMAGVVVLAALGSVAAADLAWAARTMWRPLVGIVAIMVMTGVARRLGVLEGVANLVFRRAAGSPSRLFALVFAFGAVTAAILNNDSAILLLTPLVVDAAKKRQPRLVVPLAFAVFLSAGVAPFIVSNPMNMVVASYAGIGFNEYAAHMAVPAFAGALVTFVTARLVFARELRRAKSINPTSDVALAGDTSFGDTSFGDTSLESFTATALSRVQKAVLAALACVVGSYPVVAWFGGPVWLVAVVGAVLLLGVAAAHGRGPLAIVRDEVHVDTIVFLVAVLVISIGLRNVGVVARIEAAYANASLLRVGFLSALGSAVLNNHPMSHLNMFALGGADADHQRVLAALIGGDLGPRLFPMGSLAGLLWLEMLRRAGLEVSVWRFLVVGAVATLPALVVCLLVL